MPMAMELVTYGRKKIVCKALENHLMEFKHTAIKSARKVEIGTVSTVRSTVFFKQLIKPLYFRTRVKFPIPNSNSTPRTAFIEVYPSRSDMRMVLKIGHTVKIIRSTIAGAR